jgi:hypothetical protein
LPKLPEFIVKWRHLVEHIKNPTKHAAERSTLEVDGTLESLQREGERLKQARDNEQFRQELRALSRGTPPWWRKGTVVTTLTALIAAIAPLTTAVHAHYEKEREIRASYLDRLSKPGARLRTLRFVIATTSDPDLQRWASSEKEIVEAEVAAIDQQVAGLRLQEQTATGSEEMQRIEQRMQRLLAEKAETEKLQLSDDLARAPGRRCPAGC